MSAPNLEQKAEKAVKDLLEVKNSVLPVVIGKEVVSSVSCELLSDFVSLTKLTNHASKVRG